MKSNRLLTEEVKIDSMITPQDVGTSDVTSDEFLAMDEFRKAVIIASAELTADATLTVTPVASDDDSGSETEDLTDLEITIDEGEDQEFGYIELTPHDLPDDKKYIGVKLAGSEAGDDGTAFILRGNPRYIPVEQDGVS